MSDHKEEKGHGGGGGGHHGSHGGHGGGGGHEEHEGAPEWLISFADNVMLQMGFFVILLALNLKPATTGSGGENKDQAQTNPTPEMLDWVLSIREAFNNPVSPDSDDPNEAALVARLMEKAKLPAPDPGPRGRHENVETIRPSDYVGLGGVVPFELNANELSDAGRAKAQDIARHIRGLKLLIDVRGHCSAAEAYKLDDHGMHLSYQRAWMVANELIVGGVSWNQIRITACADNERSAAREYDDAARQAHQRVEVIVTSDARGN